MFAHDPRRVQGSLEFGSSEVSSVVVIWHQVSVATVLPVFSNRRAECEAVVELGSLPPEERTGSVATLLLANGAS